MDKIKEQSIWREAARQLIAIQNAIIQSSVAVEEKPSEDEKDWMEKEADRQRKDEE